VLQPGFLTEKIFYPEMMKFLFLILFLGPLTISSRSQSINQLVEAVKAKLDKVQSYQARAKIKTNVSFLKVPIANVTVYFKGPNQIKILSDKGVSFIPKGAMSINTGSLLEGSGYTVIDGGKERMDGRDLQIARILPNDENSDVVLSTLYIDPVNLLVRKARTTTRENGTYELELSYGRYSNYGLPDKLIFSFNVKDYKLPKGITFDFDDGNSPKPTAKNTPQKGKAEIIFSSYQINQELPPGIF